MQLVSTGEQIISTDNMLTPFMYLQLTYYELFVFVHDVHVCGVNGWGYHP